MQQQSSQLPEDQFQSRQLNPNWEIHDIQHQPQSYNSSSLVNLQRPSKRNLKIKSVSSIHSRSQIIKVSKVKQIKQQQKQKQSSRISIVSSKKRQCRICLQDQKQGRLVKACKCTGSMAYAHQNCLSEWIKRKINFKLKGKVHCQVCDQPFDYKISKRLSLDCGTLKQNYSRHHSNYVCFAVLMLIMIIFWLSMLIITCIGMGSGDNWIRKYVITTQQTKIIFICVILVYALIMGFLVLLFVGEYGVKTQMVVKNVANYTKKYKKVVPRLYSIAT